MISTKAETEQFIKDIKIAKKQNKKNETRV